MENPGEKATFLYVDDEARLRELVKTIITKQVDTGRLHRHIEASDGAEALGNLHATAPDRFLEQIIREQRLIVFTDLNMPGINGLDLIKLIRAIETGREVDAITEAVKQGSITKRQRLLEEILRRISPNDLMPVEGASKTTRARIILLSTDIGSFEEQAHAEAGLRDAFLQKPFPINDVAAQARLGLPNPIK